LDVLRLEISYHGKFVLWGQITKSYFGSKNAFNREMHYLEKVRCFWGQRLYKRKEEKGKSPYSILLYAGVTVTIFWEDFLIDIPNRSNRSLRGWVFWRDGRKMLRLVSFNQSGCVFSLAYNIFRRFSFVTAIIPLCLTSLISMYNRSIFNIRYNRLSIDYSIINRYIW